MKVKREIEFKRVAGQGNVRVAYLENGGEVPFDVREIEGILKKYDMDYNERGREPLMSFVQVEFAKMIAQRTIDAIADPVGTQLHLPPTPTIGDEWEVIFSDYDYLSKELTVVNSKKGLPRFTAEFKEIIYKIVDDQWEAIDD